MNNRSDQSTSCWNSFSQVVKEENQFAAHSFYIKWHFKFTYLHLLAPFTCSFILSAAANAQTEHWTWRIPLATLLRKEQQDSKQIKCCFCCFCSVKWLKVMSFSHESTWTPWVTCFLIWVLFSASYTERVFWKTFTAVFAETHPLKGWKLLKLLL